MSFQLPVLRRSRLPKTRKRYRNPLFPAREWRDAVDSGEVKNASELARRLGLSRARVSQVLAILKLPPEEHHRLERLGDPMDHRFATERRLRRRRR
jgi:hypothetical protein